jgi:hypothetical protein
MSQGRSESRDSVHLEHNLVEAASPVEVDDSLLVSEAQVPIVVNPEMMDMDVPVEGGLGGADLDQPAQVMEAFLQEHSDHVVFENIFMEDAFPQGTAESAVQEHMEPQVHSDRDVESDEYVADTVGTEAPVLEEESSVISARAPETREIGDVVLNRGSSRKPPTLPTIVEEDEEEEVLEQAPVQNQGSSEDHSGSADSSRSVEQHPADC